jgi:hypothetical protein
MNILGIDISHPAQMLAANLLALSMIAILIEVTLRHSDDQVVLFPVSLFQFDCATPLGHQHTAAKHTIRVRTVRRVATLFREPWWSSILIRFVFGYDIT